MPGTGPAALGRRGAVAVTVAVAWGGESAASPSPTAPASRRRHCPATHDAPSSVRRGALQRGYRRDQGGSCADHHRCSVISDDGRGPRVLRRARRSRRPRCVRLLGRVRSRCPASRRRRRAGPRQDHGPDVRRRAPARATRDVPRRGRGDGHGHPPRRASGDRDREVAGLPRAGRAERQEGRGGHGDQGTAGPAGGEGPAPGRSGPRAAGPAGLRRAEGAQQLRLPTTGGRGGLGWDPGGARRPGGRTGRRAHAGRGKRGAGGLRRAARRHRRGSAPAGGVVAEVAER